jgi:hypothetical protein
MPILRPRPPASIVAALGLLLSGCGGEPALLHEPPDRSREQVVSQVLGFMEGIPPALAKNGPQGWLEKFEHGPEFRMVSDGRVVLPSIDSAKVFLENFSRSVRSLDLAWDQITVAPLGAGLATVAAGYREAVRDTSGIITHTTGAFRGVVRDGPDGWRLQQLHWTSPDPMQ